VSGEEVSERSFIVKQFILYRSSFIVGASVAVAILFGAARPTTACPFCLADEPTLAQRRESADGVALGEAAARRGDGKQQTFELHTIFKGPAELKQRGNVSIASPAAKPGSLAILFATADDRQKRVDRWDWSTAFANEALLGYFAGAPDLRQPAVKRLPYFARYLEHADRDIARDAYLEFAHAPYEDVVRVADHFDFAAVRGWLESPRVPDARKGFYGLVLGMTKRPEDRAANQSLLTRLIEADRGEFRAGFDGVLAGYLLLTGERGLKWIEERYFVSQRAKHGDVRHAMNAIRFYYEYGKKDARDDVARAVARLVERPAFAAAAITDLARWQHWQVLEQVAALYESEPAPDGPTRRAIIGYLRSCGKPEADAALDRLRKVDPDGVEAAEKVLFLPAGM
jgi:hypothetical protein